LATREATASEVMRLLAPFPYAYDVSGGDETATLLEEFAQAGLIAPCPQEVESGRFVFPVVPNPVDRSPGEVIIVLCGTTRNTVTLR
jgi:hypothetical protein